MRCRPGDLAVIVRAEESRDIGRLVEVIESAPLVHSNVGPDWGLYDGGPTAWIIRSVGSPFDLETWGGSRVSGMYASTDDDRLRPIRPDADPVETETEREVAA